MRGRSIQEGNIYTDQIGKVIIHRCIGSKIYLSGHVRLRNINNKLHKTCRIISFLIKIASAKSGMPEVFEFS